MQRPPDSQLMSLPHPVRVDAAVGRPMEDVVLHNDDLRERLGPHLASDEVSTEWIINNVPGMLELTMASVGTPAGLNAGLVMLMLARGRLRAQGDPMLQVAESLHAQLAATDLGSGLPAGFFRSPYPMVYIELARPSGLQIFNRASGLHEVEGAYIGSYRIPPHSEQHKGAGRVEHLGLDIARETRVMELTITGSPVGKDNPLDDASVDISLFIQDDDACLETLLERHIAYYRSSAVNAQPGFQIPEQTETDLAAAVIRQLAKVLLYLNLPDVEQAPLPERSRLEQRLRGLGPKKAARIKRRMATAYDRIVIGPSLRTNLDADPAQEPPQDPTQNGTARSVRPHWRRGHFRRIRYGEQLSESRLGWIRPVLVNREDAFGTVKAKPYLMR
ncbi:hypothetical protein [uncultured Thiohalocapsa sp.]|uniref:hypothetical protein n=1 Tax=uncultured Thiohalocapsa sp. TaxID=768990 RepID=UPI0025D9AE3E|nr:hypothetical protein [uncultured Thiohalocapsa sp.]